MTTRTALILFFCIVVSLRISKGQSADKDSRQGMLTPAAFSRRSVFDETSRIRSLNSLDSRLFSDDTLPARQRRRYENIFGPQVSPPASQQICNRHDLSRGPVRLGMASRGSNRLHTHQHHNWT